MHILVRATKCIIMILNLAKATRQIRSKVAYNKRGANIRRGAKREFMPETLFFLQILEVVVCLPFLPYQVQLVERNLAADVDIRACLQKFQKGISERLRCLWNDLKK